MKVESVARCALIRCGPGGLSASMRVSRKLAMSRATDGNGMGRRNSSEAVGLEFSSRSMGLPGQYANDCVYAHVEQYANHGSVLDLGAAPGYHRAPHWRPMHTPGYTGVDISAVAVEKARQRASRITERPKNTISRETSFDYIPNQQHARSSLFGDRSTTSNGD